MFAVGWPRVLASPAAGAGEAAVALEHDARADAVALVTRASVEVWNGGRHRTRAGGFARSPATVAEEGAYVAARWRDGGEVLAVAAEVARDNAPRRSRGREKTEILRISNRRILRKNSNVDQSCFFAICREAIRSHARSDRRFLP